MTSVKPHKHKLVFTVKPHDVDVATLAKVLNSVIHTKSYYWLIRNGLGYTVYGTMEQLRSAQKTIRRLSRAKVRFTVHKSKIHSRDYCGDI